MEAAPRLPMLSFDLLTSPEVVSFGKKLKPYIAGFYNEDPESYITEINKLDSLRISAMHPSKDINGLQVLKKYYCQLNFLKSRFPMEASDPCYIEFSWKDYQNTLVSGSITLELGVVLFNIGVMHTILGSSDSRSNPEGMKLACSHFQCAVWAFQTVKEKYATTLAYIIPMEIPHFYKQVCLAQAQECILEKSMLDNRKSTIISKVAIQVWEYYRQSLTGLKLITDDIINGNTCKDWPKYIQFKIAYHRCISLLFQGQQAEELQKMGERVAFYQAASDNLQEAYKFLSSKQQKELADALAFTVDVVEGKKKAAINENEYIYHEEVPKLEHLQEAKGASLVKGIEFSISDPEVSGPDIFSRLIPMEAHEAASIYSEKKAEVLRQIGQRVEAKDQALVEFMSSLQLDMLSKMHQATGIPQELIDRAASLSAKPSAIQDLIDSMAKLSNIYHDVKDNLSEIDELLQEEEQNEKNYQEIMGKRPASIITTDLAREASKYKEAHAKAQESNETLSKAMVTHLENLKILQRPIRELQQKLPSVELPDPSIDEAALQELDKLNAKVDEMKSQRGMLWAQIRDAIHNDDITSALVTKQPNQSLEDVFRTQLEKHGHMIELLDQNLVAQDNIKKAFVECYAKSVGTRRYISEIIQKRNSTIQALIASHDSYDDLLAKALKGVEFYTKLEANVSKLLQRIKGAIKVQQEEREQMLAKSVSKQEEVRAVNPVVSSTATAPKLRDYLEARKKAGSAYTAGYNYSGAPTKLDSQNWPPGVRPAPLGSEINTDPALRLTNEAASTNSFYQQKYPSADPSVVYNYNNEMSQLNNRMSNLLSKPEPVSSQCQYSYSSYIPQNYTPSSYSNTSQHYSDVQTIHSPISQDVSKAATNTTNSYQTISSYMPNSGQGSDTMTHMQYPDDTLKSGQYPGVYQAPVNNQAASQFNQYQPANNANIQYPQYQVSYGQYTQQPSSALSYSATGYNTSSSGNYGLNSQSSQSYGSTATQLGNISSNATQIPSVDARLSTHQIGGNQEVNSGSHSLGKSQNTNTTPATYQATSQYSGAEYSMQIQQQSNKMGQNYYPVGYAPNYTNPVDGASPNMTGMNQYNQQYYNNQHASSVASATTNYNPSYYSTYSAPTVDPYKGQPGESGNSYNMSTGVPPSSAASTVNYSAAVTNSLSSNYNPYGSVYGYSQPNYASTTSTNSYTYPTSTSHVANSTVPLVKPTASKESNIDLLTGLDFSASSNIPTLTPQPNIIPEAVKEPEKKPVIDIKPVQVTQKLEERPLVPPQETVRILPSKPLNNAEVKHLFKQEVDKFEKYVESLSSHTLSGPTALDLKWKEIQESQEPDGQKRIISVARCYHSKNRFPDILPYDYTRVELKTTGDDYINASFINQVSAYGPQFIVTQAPLGNTLGDFWAMVREQRVELIFCVLSDAEMGSDIYWPNEKGQNLTILNQNMVLSLQSVVVKPHWTERLIQLTLPEKKESWTVMHLQFTSWPGSLFPTSPEPFLSYVLELISLFQQQKVISHPLLVHCSSGIGRSGLTCLLANAILEATNQTTCIPDLAMMTIKLDNYRRNILRDREHLKFAYEALLCYMKQILLQDALKKKLSEVVPKEESKSGPIQDMQENIIDPLSALDPFWASKK
ncbi:tyrosine-protein phosphatase non-receptor type 23 [Anthonomus grandis grandis]|uniref:tyrosine-protein phosphatase non-receptor type 23 n=1 Tax=Anthonomus grandis grandis TaxID=2921223 RepID=UPI002165A6F9|nr:tyrosine-protein phosphatase non-receptor type 23 [Anthonomus grandis grandis]